MIKAVLRTELEKLRLVLYLLYGLRMQNHQSAGFVFYNICPEDRIDIFTKNEYRLNITDSLNFCIKEKGPEVYAWVLMTNNLHPILSSSKGNLSGIIRDFKKYTSIRII